MAKKYAKPRAKSKAKRYACSLCGMVISVCGPCSCVDVCDIICCGEQMKEKK